ncbi:class I lanthipeptide [Hymenobacter rubripertinctus]|uniref:class I lanthipeptide n=1 Tax=Hymenobacter rubripertinctus TaxID=2029981 RepID=UPI0011C35270|nr:class I lanthipeptide [Hymenobacter rubripertinctus]
MKKEQLTRKLSLNKKNISQLDSNSMNSIKGGLYASTGGEYPEPRNTIVDHDATMECSDGCQSRGCTVA